MHDLYNKLYLERHQHKTLYDSTKAYNLSSTQDDVERRMKKYIKENFDVLDTVELPEGDDDAAWDKMFDAYKTKTHQNTEEAWNQIINQYQRTHEEEELPFKTIGEFINDYFADGDEGHMCAIDKDVPKYFYYKGKKFQIDFSLLDSVHKHVLDYKKENNHTIEEALMHFTHIGENHFDPDHGHEHDGDHHLMQKKKEKESTKLRW